MIQEKLRNVSSGYVMLVVLAVAQLATAYAVFTSARAIAPLGIVASVLSAVIVLVFWAGFFMVNPNEAKALQLFGAYVGTVRDPGLKWANPFFQPKNLATRVR